MTESAAPKRVRWHEARCNHEPDVFSSKQPDDIRLAVQYCRTCPVGVKCALNLPITTIGVWAGRPDSEQRVILRSADESARAHRLARGVILQAMANSFRRGKNNQGRDWLLRICSDPNCPSMDEILTVFGDKLGAQRALAVELIRAQVLLHEGPLRHEDVEEWSRKGLVFSKTTLHEHGWSPGDIYQEAGATIKRGKRRNRNELLEDFRQLCWDAGRVISSHELHAAGREHRCAAGNTYFKYFPTYKQLVAEAFPDGFIPQGN